MLDKVCKICGCIYEITEQELKFYSKFDFEPLDYCFECSQKNRLCFRNERNLYNRKCDATGMDIISIYSHDKPYIVYNSEYWFSDAWDACDYGRDFDFNRPFFDQFKELQLSVPRLALMNFNGENSEYCNMTMGNKNCHLLFGGDFNEDCMYGTLCMHNKNCFDLDYSNYNQNCYMMCDCIDCFESSFCFDSKNCKKCYFVSDCVSCVECILCTNLKDKSFCINNVQYSEQEYFAKKKKLINGSFERQKMNFKYLLNLRGGRIVKYSHSISCEHCNGDYLKNCKKCFNTFDASDSENLGNVIFASKAKDSFNCSIMGDGCVDGFNSVAFLTSKRVKMSYFVADSEDVNYCDTVIGSHNLFGCVCLRRRSYCILNKQYTEEEYFELLPRIIAHMKKTGEWGEFFPKTFSCFGYNESTANTYFPLYESDAVAQGFNWCHSNLEDEKKQLYKIPDLIEDAGVEVCDQMLACIDCSKNYQIIKEEFDFYKKFDIPIPRYCDNCRHEARVEMRNPRQLWDRFCDRCHRDLKTSYSSSRLEEVLCEKCYVNPK